MLNKLHQFMYKMAIISTYTQVKTKMTLGKNSQDGMNLWENGMTNYHTINAGVVQVSVVIVGNVFELAGKLFFVYNNISIDLLEMRDCGNKRYQETCQTCPNKDDNEPQNNCGGDCEWNEELKSCQLKGNK